MGRMEDRTQPYAVIRSSGVTEEDVNNFIKAWNQWAQSRGLLDAYDTPVSLIPYP